MTAQMNDTVIYRGKGFNLVGIDGDGLFDPTKHGYSPRYICTALGRGYLAEYTIEVDRLVLSRLSMTVCKDDPMPPLLGVEAIGLEPSDPNYDWIWPVFEGLDIPVSFTGTLVLAHDFVEELYEHMGFHPDWKYREVIELTLKSGIVTRFFDRSLKMAKVRNRLKRRPLRPATTASRDETMAWINDTFSRKVTDYNQDELEESEIREPSHPWWKFW